MPDTQPTPPPQPAPPQADLYLIGTGIGGPGRLTREAEALIAGAAAVLHLSPLDAELRALCSGGEVHSLEDVYTSSDDPRQVYEAITQRILVAGVRARRAGRYACFVTYGHPLWLVNSARDALLRAPRRDLVAQAVPGVSSFDTLLIDSPVHLDWGAQLYEAQRFVHFRLAVETRMPLVLFQFGDFGSQRLRPDPQQTARFEPLLARLRALYPPTHPVYIVLSAWREGMKARITEATLETLGAHLAMAHVGTTLVVPPLEASHD